MLFNDVKCTALFDSGCTGMVVNEAFIKANPSIITTPASVYKQASVADRRIIPITQECRHVQVTAGPTSANYNFVVAPIRYDAILGLPWIINNNAQVDWKNRALYTTSGKIYEYKEPLPELNEIVPFNDNKTEILNEPEDIEDHVEAAAETTLINELIYEDLLEPDCEHRKTDNEEPKHHRAEAIIKEYSDRLRIELPDELPPRRITDAKLELRPNAELKNRPIYRMSATETSALQEILESLKKKGQIYECDAPFASPAFLIKKKNSSYRLLVDMRQLNDAIKDYSWPLPNIHSLLDRCKGSTVFSTIDMVSGYQQVRIHPDSESLTAFRCPLGVYAWRTLPQGCKVSPSAFSRTMQTIFKDLPFVCVYLDDILICSKSEDEHERHLRIVFDRLRKNQLFASNEKTHLFLKKVEYLGHIVSDKGIQTDPKKIDAIKSWPIPTNVKQVRQLLGAFGYYRRFVPNFSNVAAPLTYLMSKDAEFNWNESCQQAFEQLKRYLCSAPILRPFDENLKTFVMTDASDFAVGAVLEQEHPDGRHPVEYVSKSLNTAQRKYEVHNKELFAIVLSLEHWNHYLMGKHTIVETDHHPLKYIKTQKKLSPVQMRWLDVINEHDIEIIYKPGKENGIADGLSRRPDLEITAVHMLREDNEFLNQARQNYKTDHYFAAVYRALKEPEVPVQKDLATKAKRFRLNNGLLYYVNGKEPRLCIPRSKDLYRQLIKENHDSQISGHLGFDATLSRLQPFYWPRMDKTVSQYVSTCDTCQRIKDRTQLKYGLLYPHDVPPHPFHTVSLDLITTLPKTGRGNDAILVIICKLSKFTYLFPLKEHKSSAQEIAKLYFETIFRHHGLPYVIVSDRDPRFTSSFWQELFKITGTKLNMTSANHPEGDGETERRNRTVEQILRAYTNYKQDNWDLLLPYVEFAINSSKQSSTSKSPMNIVFGHEPATPNYLVNPNYNSSQINSVNDFIIQHRNTIQMVQDALTKSQDEMAAYANKSRRHIEFSVGDKVLVNAKQLSDDYERNRESRKLNVRWLGPYEIIQKISPVAYKLKLPTNSKAHNAFHVSTLKPYFEQDDELDRPEAVIEDRYEVDYIITDRIHKKKKQYLVKWAGYSEAESTWINKEDIDPEITTQYNQDKVLKDGGVLAINC